MSFGFESARGVDPALARRSGLAVHPVLSALAVPGLADREVAHHLDQSRPRRARERLELRRRREILAPQTGQRLARGHEKAGDQDR